jgi:hypothetical protein
MIKKIHIILLALALMSRSNSCLFMLSPRLGKPFLRFSISFSRGDRLGSIIFKTVDVFVQNGLRTSGGFVMAESCPKFANLGVLVP